jgi:hypothetical protein
MEKTGTGPIALRNAIKEGDIKLGGLAQNFLNRQLEGKKAKPVGPVSERTPGKPQDTRVTPAPKPGQQAQQYAQQLAPGQQAQQPAKQVAPFNSGSNPFSPFQQMQAGANKTQAAKAAAAKKAQAKAKAQAAKKK